MRERYPTFIDAIRDLEDCLCLCFLYATFPKTSKVRKAHNFFWVFILIVKGKGRDQRSDPKKIKEMGILFYFHFFVNILFLLNPFYGRVNKTASDHPLLSSVWEFN